MTEILGDLRWLKDGDTHVILLSPIEFRLNNGKIVIAEKGFRYDGGSIPRPFRSIVTPFGSRADMSWCVHDRIYAGHRELGETDFTRLEADDAMLEMHHHLEVSEFVAHGSWAAVRGGALMSWMNPAEKEEWDEGVSEEEGWYNDYLDL